MQMDWQGIEALVFDLDGTLLDSAAGIVQAASVTLAHYGLPELPAGYQMPNMHGTAGDLIRELFAERGHALPAGADEMGRVFEEIYGRQVDSPAPLYPGALAWLDWAQQQDLALGVCTNKKYDLAMKALDAVGITQRFEVITGWDTYGVYKPAPEPLAGTMKRMGVRARQTLFFGDTHADAACANACGVGFALHSVGYGDARVADYPRVLSYASYAELLSAVAQPA